MPSNTEITPKQLARLIGTPEAPVLVDVCIDEDFAADPRLIPGAFRWPFREIEALVPRLSGRRVVVICQKGLKLSQGAVAVLRACLALAQTVAQPPAEAFRRLPGDPVRGHDEALRPPPR